MTKARAHILAKLKARPSRQGITLHKPQELPMPPLPSFTATSPAALLERFCTQCEANRIEIHRTSAKSWAEILCNIAERKELKHWLIGTQQPHADQAVTALHQGNFKVSRYDTQIEDLKDTLFDSIDASLTLAQAAIAETGTLVVIPDQHEPRTMSLVPAVHIALLKQSDIVSTFQGCLKKLPKPMPTNALFISSPSKTADIQQTLAYGAHGPKELIVLIVED